MTPVIEQIIYAITEAHLTFANLALTGDTSAEVFGPRVLGKRNAIPGYGFSDVIIGKVASGDYEQVADKHNVIYCGSIFSVIPTVGEGIRSLPLMMRLARAEIIAPTNYSEGRNLDAWSATIEAGAEMRTVLLEMSAIPTKGELRALLSPRSPVQAGRSLYQRIRENYY